MVKSRFFGMDVSVNIFDFVSAFRRVRIDIIQVFLLGDIVRFPSELYEFFLEKKTISYYHLILAFFTLDTQITFKQ